MDYLHIGVPTSGEVDAVHELGNVFHHILQVKDESSVTGNNALPSDDDSISSSGVEDENIAAGDSNIKQDLSMATSSKCLQKCATFPVAVGPQKTADSQYEKNSCARSFSLPTASKLVSAMKGGRQKEGLPPRKLSVTWAPDVYDPPPTSVSHHPKKKTQQQHYKSSKKHGKGKHKGKSVRGAGGSGPKEREKEKKHHHHHHRKMGGRSERCLDSFAESAAATGSVISVSSNNYKSSVELLDFDNVGDGIGSPDNSNCGSSFRGKASATLHYAYAEAS